MIKIDYSLLLKNKLANGVDLNSEASHVEFASRFASVTKDMIEEKYGFVEIVKNHQSIDECRKVFEEVKWAKQVVVVGIGGSDLGTRMLQQALQLDEPSAEVLFVGDTTDPEQYRQLFLKLKPETALVNIVSKSGSTTEPAAGYLLLKALFQKEFGEKWGEHFVFTTDARTGIMRQEATKHNILTLNVPDDVGGRFSVLTTVGLFPALFMGIDIEALVDGANEYAQSLALKSQITNDAWLLALSQFLLQRDQNINTVVMMPYVWRLGLFSNWFAQLWAESLGKDGKGILPIKAMGPADQHSQAQFYNQGMLLSSFLFIKAKYYYSDVVLQNTEIEELNYMNHLPLEDVVKAECDATRLALVKSGRPTTMIEIECLDEKHVGSLIMLFELSVVYLAKLLDVNPFDQPGVEAGKHYTDSLLGKPGNEKYLLEIEKVLK